MSPQSEVNPRIKFWTRLDQLAPEEPTRKGRPAMRQDRAMLHMSLLLFTRDCWVQNIGRSRGYPMTPPSVVPLELGMTPSSSSCWIGLGGVPPPSAGVHVECRQSAAGVSRCAKSRTDTDMFPVCQRHRSLEDRGWQSHFPFLIIRTKTKSCLLNILTSTPKSKANDLWDGELPTPKPQAPSPNPSKESK